MISIGLWPGLVLGLLGLGRWQTAQPLSLSRTDIRPRWESDWIKTIIANDPATKSIVSGYLSGLSSAGYDVGQQGVWISAGQYNIAGNEGKQPKPAASLTKVATTLAALSTWEPEHRFETWVGWQGRYEEGIVTGDLVIEGGDDPLFVWEEAIALANALQTMGIRQVTGNLVIAGPFSLNFEADPSKSGTMLKQAMNSATWDYEIEEAYLEMPPDTPAPTLQIDGDVQATSTSQRNRISGWFIRHDSLPLVAVLKAMNIYSNNPMAEKMANILGGPAAIVQKIETVAGVAPGEIRLINGSGLGEENQMSPRAAVAMMQEIQNVLRSHNLTIADVFPVAGTDGGTLTDRSLPNNTVVKTGSLAVVSALTGALPTEKRGVVWFSLINYGLGLDALRARQDRVLRSLEQQWGQATEIPPELRTTIVIGQEPYQFGNPQRNKIVVRTPLE
ncbi:MAG: D-alanyl-D-alanine carboxypeptidase [Cyanobacteria bacterium J06649_4]